MTERIATGSVPEHLDEEVVAALVAGTLPGDERDRATAHLDTCTSCRDWIAEAALAASAHDAPGYRIGGELARGAMGRIVVAEDLRLGREVVLKQLIEPSPALRARFEREVTITARLQHPGIVPVYQAGTLSDGEPFYAMRRVHGRALDVVIAEATTPAARLALVPRVLAAIEAVAYAHSRGVVHRDLKPHNILVGEFGEVVVVDWGLAKELGAEHDGPGSGDARDPMLTSDGAILGTPAYMAPEQASGGTTDARSDVYALGAVLYHALAGTPPHTGASLTAALAVARSGAITPLGDVAPGVPADLVAITQRALASEPSARYRDAGELAADLREFLAGRLVSAHAYTRWQLVRRWIARHRAAVAATAIAVTAIAVVGAISVSRVRGERDRAQSQQAASEVLVGFMLDDLRPPLEGVGKLSLLEGAGKQVDGYYAALAERAEPTAEMLKRWGSARLLLGDVAYDRGELEAAHRHYDAARDMWERAQVHDKLAASFDRLGDVAREQGKLGDALALFRRGLAIRDALPEPDVRGYGVSYLKIGDIERSEGKLDAALASYSRSRDAFAKVSTGPGREILVVLGRLSIIEGERGNLAGAEAASRDELAYAERWLAGKPDDPQRRRAVASAHTHLAGTQADAGNFEAALASYERARDLHAALAASDPDNAVWRGSLAEQWGHIGSTLLALDREADAVAAYREELAARTALAALDPTNASAQSELAFAYYHVGLGENRMKRLAASVAAHRAAVAIHEKLLAAQPDATLANELAVFHDAVADSERDRGELKAALAASNAGLAITARWREQAGGASWDLREADLLWGRARIAKALGDKQLEVDSLRAARALFASVDKASLTAMQEAVQAEVDKQLADATGTASR